MLITRIEDIFTREGFMIKVTRDGNTLRDLRKDGILGPYNFRRRLAASKTVREWATERFEKSYPGYSCEVLKADGSVARGQTSLKNVRKTY